ncbi:hypothetical protein TM48_01445 [Mycobacterium shottsii]|uniref:Uncharacterized protein n=1 Tax=Mycobacterium shottsii TaxID=133549 RepID=A0A7I7LAA3_9MYCO|nr:hypothetical protein [Mycobacterium shottsii]QYL27243.1 hypothetical protein TM48_01445 [Mycobacterium shottsii]BBX56961.1 hypothetical protein MSHO_23060 [Mycobacterium shottsii]
MSDETTRQEQPDTDTQADTNTDETQQTEATDKEHTLSWLLAEAHHRLDNPDVNREAARHRAARREAEAQTTAVTAQLEAMQRSVVDDQVKRLDMKPEAFWAVNTLADVLGETGLPDPAKVEQAAASAREKLGIIKLTAEQRFAGLRSGAMAVSPPRKTGFAEAFSPKDRER